MSSQQQYVDTKRGEVAELKVILRNAKIMKDKDKSREAIKKVVGVAKLYRINPPSVKETDLVDVLYNMIKDKDPEVISNSMIALNEILASEGGMASNQTLVTYLLSRIKEFNEWGQCAVLELVAKYSPASNEEMFDIMNLLEDRVKHANAAVVLATAKVFLNFTKALPKVHMQVYSHLKAPLITLMGSANVELAYAVLSHIAYVVQRAPGIFDDSYKSFYCRYSDPVCVKIFKMSILTDLANEKNYQDILNEISEYVADVDMEIAKKAIQGIARIAIRIEVAADEALEHLLSLLNLNTDYVTSEACIVIKDVLRKYPERYEEVVPAMQKCLKNIEDTDGKVAVIWMIGEYGDTIVDAPYILEPLIDNFSEEASHAVRMELLTAAMKLFFKRPPEMQQMLGKLLSKAIADTGKADVRDRALLYYRLLKYDVLEAARIVNCPKKSVDVFAENQDKEVKEKVFREFNTLSVLFGMPAEKFMVKAKSKEDEEDEEDTTTTSSSTSSTSSSKATVTTTTDQKSTPTSTATTSSSSSTSSTSSITTPSTPSAAHVTLKKV